MIHSSSEEEELGENSSLEPPGATKETPRRANKIFFAPVHFLGWRQRMAVHFRKSWYLYVFFLLTWICSSLFIYFAPHKSVRLLNEMWKLRYTLHADYNYDYSDSELFQEKCAQAAASQPRVFFIDHQINEQNRKNVRARLDELFKDNDGIFSHPSESSRALSKLLKEPQAVTSLTGMVDDVLSTGIIAAKEKATISEEKNAKDSILIISDTNSVYTYKMDIPSSKEAVKQVSEKFAKQFEVSSILLTDFLDGVFSENLIFDEARTQNNRELAAKQVQMPKQYKKRGSTVVELTQNELERLQAYASRKSMNTRPWLERLADFLDIHNMLRVLLIGLLLFVYGVILFRAHALSTDRMQHVTLCTLAINLHCLFIFLGCVLHSRFNQPLLLLLPFLPVALMPAMISSLLGGRTAICTILLIVILLPLQVQVASCSFELFYLTLFIGIIGLLCFQKASYRMDYIFGGVIMSVSIALASVYLGCAVGMPWGAIQGQILSIVGYSFVNGVIIAFGCLLFLPLLEVCFGLATSTTLMELCDVSHPLLLRLQREAPGTYQHSSNVAILASAAAQEIHANATLTRAFAFYHDIGKLYNPQNFAENMHGGCNLYDALTPEEGSQMVREHVTYGLELAYKYHMRRPIYPAIERHHGSSIMRVFYEKAKKDAEKRHLPMPDESKFRYPYPLPIKKEVVILSLADACEAAVRSMFTCCSDYKAMAEKIISTVYPAIEQGEKNQAELTKKCMESTGSSKDSIIREEDIRKMLDKIFTDKWLDGQLNEAEITLHELQEVKMSFLKNFRDMYHTRPQYPESTSSSKTDEKMDAVPRGKQRAD